MRNVQSTYPTRALYLSSSLPHASSICLLVTQQRATSGPLMHIRASQSSSFMGRLIPQVSYADDCMFFQTPNVRKSSKRRLGANNYTSWNMNQLIRWAIFLVFRITHQISDTSSIRASKIFYTETTHTEHHTLSQSSTHIQRETSIVRRVCKWFCLFANLSDQHCAIMKALIFVFAPKRRCDRRFCNSTKRCIIQGSSTVR